MFAKRLEDRRKAIEKVQEKLATKTKSSDKIVSPSHFKNPSGKLWGNADTSIATLAVQKEQARAELESLYPVQSDLTDSTKDILFKYTRPSSPAFGEGDEKPIGLPYRSLSPVTTSSQILSLVLPSPSYNGDRTYDSNLSPIAYDAITPDTHPRSESPMSVGSSSCDTSVLITRSGLEINIIKPKMTLQAKVRRDLATVSPLKRHASNLTDNYRGEYSDAFEKVVNPWSVLQPESDAIPASHNFSYNYSKVSKKADITTIASATDQTKSQSASVHASLPVISAVNILEKDTSVTTVTDNKPVIVTDISTSTTNPTIDPILLIQQSTLPPFPLPLNTVSTSSSISDGVVLTSSPKPIRTSSSSSCADNPTTPPFETSSRTNVASNIQDANPPPAIVHIKPMGSADSLTSPPVDVTSIARVDSSFTDADIEEDSVGVTVSRRFRSPLPTPSQPKPSTPSTDLGDSTDLDLSTSGSDLKISHRHSVRLSLGSDNGLGLKITAISQYHRKSLENTSDNSLSNTVPSSTAFANPNPTTATATATTGSAVTAAAATRGSVGTNSSVPPTTTVPVIETETETERRTTAGAISAPSAVVVDTGLPLTTVGGISKQGLDSSESKRVSFDKKALAIDVLKPLNPATNRMDRPIMQLWEHEKNVEYPLDKYVKRFLYGKPHKVQNRQRKDELRSNVDRLNVQAKTIKIVPRVPSTPPAPRVLTPIRGHHK